MDEQVFLARRATLDDLPVLRELWQREQLDADGLERRVTEFQVAYDAEGTIVGAIGMRRDGEQGMVHSEAFADFGVADQLRTLIWERLKTIAKNYAMARVWMQDPGMFWKELGFDEVEGKTLEQLPAVFGESDGNWFSIMLRNDPFADGSAAAKQQELLFRQALKDETDRTLRQAKNVKVVALGLSIILFIVICIAGFALFKYQQKMGLRSPMGQR
jgi:N-acetylglutamate synthase-like GNAT family acetyltransferase